MLAKAEHSPSPTKRNRVPLWLKVLYSLFMCILVPVYWYNYGPTNFLWASDIALFFTLAALWLEHPLPNSMMVVGVLPLEIAWAIDLVSGAHLFGITTYMFRTELALYLRALSLFHVILPPIMIFLLFRLGYDRRALVAQTLLTWTILPLTYLVTGPEDNINLVYGFGHEPQTTLPPLAYLALEMALIPILICVPCHFAMRWLFRRR